MKLKDMKIKFRLTLGFLISCIVSALLIIFSLLNTFNMQKDYESIINDYISVRVQILTSRININTAARYIRDITLDISKVNYSNNISKLNNELDNLKKSAKYVSENYPLYFSDGKEKEFLASINNWSNTVPSILDEIEKNNFELAKDMLINQCTPELNKQAEVSEKITSSINMSIDEILRTQDKNIFSSLIVLSVSLILVLLFSFIFAQRVIASIVKPVNEVKEAITAMSMGKLKVPVNYESRDEIGEMAEALRTSQNVLQTVISDIDYTTSELAKGNFDIKSDTYFPGDLKSISVSTSKVVQNFNSTIEKIKRLVEQVNLSSHQVAHGAQSLAEGATEQASSVEELSATLNDISEAAIQNSEFAKVAKENTDKAGGQNVVNKEKMRQMIEAMNDITSTSQEIRKIIKTIEDIAFQTNILALNAAVEAARAGTAGKGFAVVADEVRNLASKSAEAAQNTTKLIEDSIRAVENGSNIARSTAESIESSAELTEQAVEQITQIAQAIERESESIKQITLGIDQIATVVQTNSATSEESAAASEELSSQASVMQELLSHFNTLPNMVNTDSYSNELITPVNSNSNVVNRNQTIVNQSTPRYEVTSEIATGNELIDSEHTELFNAINNLLAACSNGQGRSQINSTVDFLVDYVDKHFRDEEELQKQYKYPNYNAHHKFHEKYKSDIRELANNIKLEGSNMNNVSRVNALASMLISHIKQEDKRLAAHIKSSSKY